MGQDVGQDRPVGQEAGRLWDRERERERKRLYRERKRGEERVDPSLPVVDVNEMLEVGAGRSLEVLLALDPLAALTDEEEQRIRDHFGYASSETRTRAERELAARRMLAGRPGARLERSANDLAPGERGIVDRAFAALRAKEQRG